MKHALLRGMALLLLVFVVSARGLANDMRFSQTLNADDKSTAGLSRLTSDEVAVIDPEPVLAVLDRREGINGLVCPAVNLE